jgi:hypothetical protein
MSKDPLHRKIDEFLATKWGISAKGHVNLNELCANHGKKSGFNTAFGHNGANLQKIKSSSNSNPVP